MTSYDERITTYFGDAVLRAGFMPVPHLLMRHYRALDLLAEHAMFALQLMEITWDLAQPPVTMRKIAERMGISVRTAQRYSEYLAARGLIVIYEQFEDGAQVENGYDLAPLFRALAAFAPEPRPGGMPRERRRRSGVPAEAAASSTGRHAQHGSPTQQPRDTPDTRPRDRFVIPPHDIGVIPPRDTADTPVGDTPITPPGDRSVIPGPTPLTGLKGVQESPKKQQEPDVAVAHAKQNEPPTPAAGRSLRLEQDLSTADVSRSGRLLDSAGLHPPVARTCAAALAPSEALALLAYARAAGLGTGWIAAQIYDFERRAPRTPDLARRWDEAGARLAALDDDTALQLLELVDRYAPHDPASLLGDPRYGANEPRLRQAAAAVWTLMHEARGGGASTRKLPESAGPPAAASEATDVWHTVLERLRGDVAAAEYETWLRPARLLVLEDNRAIVGTDNIFAREHLQQVHGDMLARAFAAVLGRATRVDVVIG